MITREKKIHPPSAHSYPCDGSSYGLHWGREEAGNSDHLNGVLAHLWVRQQVSKYKSLVSLTWTKSEIKHTGTSRGYILV